MSYEFSSGSKPFFEVGFFIIIRSSECESLRSGFYAYCNLFVAIRAALVILADGNDSKTNVVFFVWNPQW